jgi:ubiquinone/menaquinone biosynthesis C-methylase UbiE
MFVDSSSKNRSKLYRLVGQSPYYVERIIRSFWTKPTSEIWLLEAGSGHGAWSNLLSRKGYEVVGVDIQNMRLKEAKRRVTNKSVSFLAGDLLRTPFKQETFHVCFCSYVLHHFRRIDFILAELLRVTKRDGEFLISEPNGSNLAYRLTEFVKKFTPRNWMMRKGINTTNETIHSPNSYINFMATQSFSDVEVRFANSREVECPFDGRVLAAFIDAYGFAIGVILFIRMLLFKAISKIPNSTLSCNQLVIHARKNRT